MEKKKCINCGKESEKLTSLGLCNECEYNDIFDIE